MGLWRRRRKSVLTILAALVLALVAGLQLLNRDTEPYQAGERTAGLTDSLARDVPADHPQVRFDDVASEAGIDFQQFPEARTTRLPEDMGSGVAIADVDGDGDLDVFLVGAGGARSRLYLGGGDGAFEDATESSGIDLQIIGMAAAFVDVDGDADLDLFVSSYGRCYLFRNDGAARFADVSTAAGLDEFQGFYSGIAVSDCNHDGAMDVYVCGYVVYDEEKASRASGSSQYGTVIPARINPSTFDPERNLLLIGDGRGGFQETAAAAGVANATGRSLGALFCDLNGDGHPDLYVANDVSDNALFLGRGDGTFVDRTTQALVGDYRGAMGLALGDVDGNLRSDIFITHWVAQENALYFQHEGAPAADGDVATPIYMDEADRHGLGAKALNVVGWAARFLDYDNDGRRDLFVINGSTIPEASDPSRMKPERSHLFWRSPRSRGFFEVGAVSGDFWREEHVGRGGATGDLDRDGDEDLVVVLHGERARVLANEGGNAKPCLRLRLRQSTGNRFAIGARIVATIGEEQTLELLDSQGSYLSQHAVGEVAFGMGDAAVVDRIEVTWPDGTTESAGPFLASSVVTWERGRPPRTAPFPGRRELDLATPATIEGQRSFHAALKAAHAARLAGELETALAGYREALGLWPGHGDSLYYLGNTLLELGREVEALDAFERLVWFEPRGSRGWMQLGLMRLPGGLAELDDLDVAAAAFQRAHEINGEESRPTVHLGIAAMLRGELETAARHFDDAARLNPRSIEARWFAGKVAYLAGDPERAGELLAAARELAGIKGAGASPSNEGDTKTGGALTSEAAVPLEPGLTRWRTLGERPLDLEAEYSTQRTDSER